MIRSLKSIALQATASLSLTACVVTSPPTYEAPPPPRTQTSAAPTNPQGAKNVIILISDGIGFNGWLAADYYQGRAGTQSYQVTRPDGTQPVLLGMAHSSLNLVDAQGAVLASASDAKLAAGAVEQSVLRAGEGKDIIFVEGQGSLLNPGSTATLPLLRGTQPTHLILVHKAGLPHLQHFPDFQIPPLPKVVALYESVARAGGTFAPASVAGIALNTFGLNEKEAQRAITKASNETGLPCTDVVRFGAEPLLVQITKINNLTVN